MLNIIEQKRKKLSLITSRELIDTQENGKNIFFEVQNKLESNYVWI